MMTICKKNKRGRSTFRKGRDMAALTRRYSFYSEYLKAQLDERELGLCFMHSSMDKLIRGNDVYDKGLRS